MFFCVSKETKHDMLWQRDTEKFDVNRQPEGQARHEGCAKRTKQASARTKVRKRAREDATKQDDVDGTSDRIR